MAKTVDKLLILVGDGATPEVFKSPCALNSRSIQFSAQVQEDQVLTCPGSDPDAFDPEPGWIEKVKTALSASARGSGKLAATDKPMWWDWFTGGEKNIRIYLRAKDKTELKGHF
ncbi:MAG: hypothetical protein PHN62_17290, partial [Neomegalonema sp.]|nr:hypothetical protein [Neomegalonema sp.]